MKKLIIGILIGLFAFPWAQAQPISSHQYRRVAPENMQEYLKRETTYWAKFAESEIKKGNMTFWAILQRMGSENMEKDPNILIINTFKDIDKGADWASVDAMFPDVKMEDIQTNTLSINTSQVLLRGLDNHTEVADADIDRDFKYVKIIYHNVKDQAKHLAFEAEKWKPLVEKAMAEGKTTMKGWGNAVILLPESEKFQYNTQSYDLFTTAHAALSPAFSEDFEIPEGFFDGLEENYDGPRDVHLYRVVAVRAAPPTSGTE